MRDLDFSRLTEEQKSFVFDVLTDLEQNIDTTRAILRGEQADRYIALGAQQIELREIIDKVQRVSEE